MGGMPFDLQALFANAQFNGMGFPGQGFPGQQFEQPQQQQAENRHHPTAASTLRTLPRVKVTAHDLAANEGTECTICLEELVEGETALRIPCGHLFHEECVKDWLKKSNECPVCRFEMPSDDKEHERGRSERMAGRKIRLRMADLTVKSVQELNRLAHFIGVDVRGCIEKKEITDRIAASEKVEIILAEGEELPASSSSCAGLPRSTWLQGGGANGSAASAEPASPPRAQAPAAEPAAVVGEAELVGKSIGELKRIAQSIGASLDGCLEKGDIVQRIVARSADAAR